MSLPSFTGFSPMNRSSQVFAALVFLTASGALVAQEGPAKPPSSEASLYQYLLSEIAQQRGQPALAWQGMMDLARKGRDARVARRAAELAFQSRQLDLAAESCLLWAELEPASPVMRQALGVLAGNNGHIADVQAKLGKWLNEERAPVIFMQAPAIFAKYPEKADVLTAMHELAKPYAMLPEAHWALAQAALAANDFSTANAEVDQAIARKPGWSQAAILKTQIIREGGGAGNETAAEAAAEKYLQSFLAEYPAANDARVVYARLLVAAKGYLSAREQFRLAANAQPDDPELPYAIALLSQQIGEYDAADAQLKKVLDLKPRDTNPVYFNLGVVAELRKDRDGAMGWYRRVAESEYFVPAQLKIATMLARQDGLPAARKFLRESREAQGDNNEVRNQLVLAEVQLLREAKAWQDAYTLLSDSLTADPDAADLLYDRAMIAEKLGKIDLLEADLRRVIALQPERSHAYNALGYTLAERNMRLDEASELIRKAASLSPEDMYIQDSLGWVQYRQGKVAEALATLTHAYQARRDPEIAAHLGEVLWTLGKKGEARGLLEGALLENPGNDALIATLDKLKP